MYAPHVVTIYNVIQETDLETFEEVEKAYITILTNVFLDESKGVNVRMSGLESADAVNLIIPFGVYAVDPFTGQRKYYLSPQQFWAATDDERSQFWTLSVEGNGGETFFVKWSHREPVNVARALDDAYNVTKVDIKDFGSPRMQHWEVGGA